VFYILIILLLRSQLSLSQTKVNFCVSNKSQLPKRR